MDGSSPSQRGTVHFGALLGYLRASVVAVPVEARYASAEQEFRKSHFRLFRDLYNITSHTVKFILARGDVVREYRVTRAHPPVIDQDA